MLRKTTACPAPVRMINRTALPGTDPNGRMDIVKDAGRWLRDEKGNLTKAFTHICWDGCMFPNSVMHNQQTWNDILAVMIKVREAHGWQE